MAADSAKMREELAALQGQMEDFNDKGSSATARCLVCFSRRAQNPNKIVVGTDGKTYFQTAGGQVNLGRLGIPGMSSSMNVPGRKQRSVSPQMSRSHGATSLPSL